MEVVGCALSILNPISTYNIPSSSSSSSCSPSSDYALPSQPFTKRRSIIFTASVVATFYLQLCLKSPFQSAIAQQLDETQLEEDRVVRLFEETSPSVVFIKDLEIINDPKNSDEVVMVDNEKAKVEGTGSGFIWDTFGHIVTNYHVVEKLATDQNGRQRCKVASMRKILGPCGLMLNPKAGTFTSFTITIPQP